MSFPYSRTNIQKTNPYAMRGPAWPFSNPATKNVLTMDPNRYDSPYTATEIPYHNAYTSLPAHMNAAGYVVKPMSTRNPTIDFIMAQGKGWPSPYQLERNKAMSNPYNTYPFYDDPSVMWSTPNNYTAF